MKRKAAINSIQNAFEDGVKWLKYGQCLVEGKGFDSKYDPDSFKLCDFGLGPVGCPLVAQLSWVKDVQEQHQNAYDAYQIIYDETLRVYAPKKQDELLVFFTELECQVARLHEVLDRAKENLLKVSDEEFQELCSQVKNKNNQQQSNQVSGKEMKEPTDVKNISQEQLKFCQQLKLQDVKQLDLEKKLTQQELQQIEERKHFTQQSVDQLKQYQLLVQQETESLDSVFKEKEIKYKQEQDAKMVELDNLKYQQQNKQSELKNMELLSLKLEQKKHEGHKQEREAIKLLEEQELLLKEDVLKIDQQQEKRQLELEQLQKQVQLATEELEQLTTSKKTKLQEIKGIKSKISLREQEFEKENSRQQQLYQHKLQVEESKLKALNSLKEQYQNKQNELVILEENIQRIKIDKNDSTKLKQKELEDLKNSEKLKQECLDALEEDYRKKQKDLDEVERQKLVIDEELIDLKKALEPKIEEDESVEDIEKV